MKKIEESNKSTLIMLAKKLKEKDNYLETLHLIIAEKNSQIISFEEELIKLRKELLYYEKKSIVLREEKLNFEGKINKEILKNESLKFQNEIFERQIGFLTDQLSKSEITISKLLQEKQFICKKKNNSIFIIFLNKVFLCFIYLQIKTYLNNFNIICSNRILICELIYFFIFLFFF